MRSILNGILLTTITMTFAAWLLSSVILRIIQASKPSSLDNESIAEKIKYGKDSMSHAQESPSISSYARAGRQTYSRDGVVRFQKPGPSPFGAKLNLRSNSNPFAPKLRIRRKYSWSHRRRPESNPQKKQYQQTNTSSNKKSSSPIISGYQNYIDILNDQMKD